jgi:hypothetical protein
MSQEVEEVRQLRFERPPGSCELLLIRHGDRKTVTLTLNGTVTVRGSEITVTQKSQGFVITTSSTLLATAVIVNDDAAGKITSTWWNPSGNLAKRSILLPGATWEPVIAGGEFRTIKVCSLKE